VIRITDGGRAAREGLHRHILMSRRKQELNMTTGSVDAGRELTADELNSVSGGRGKELESQDRLGNFEIQNLISRYNQAETL
jgi:hypothetical protein